MLSPIYYPDTLPFFQSHTYQLCILSYTICFNMLSHTYNPNTLSFHQSHSYQFIVPCHTYIAPTCFHTYIILTPYHSFKPIICYHTIPHIKSISHETYLPQHVTIHSILTPYPHALISL